VIILLPFLLIFYRITFLYEYNIHFVSFGDYLIALITFLLIASLSLYKYSEKKSMFVFVFFCCVFSYGRFYHTYKVSQILLITVIISILIIAYLLIRKINFSKHAKILSVPLVVLCLLTISALLNSKINYNKHYDSHPLTVAYLKLEEKKDVHLILLDSYMRQDSLLELYGYDNSKFINQLEDRGFNVADESVSNYNFTRLTMPSMLNMKYLKGYKEMNSYTQVLMDNNHVVDIFELNGYDVKIFKSKEGFTEYIYSITLFVACRVPLFYNLRRHSIERKLKNIYTYKSDKPLFMYTHIMPPHNPFLFNESGKTNKYLHYKKIRGAEYIYAYIQQLKWLNKELIKVIDKLPKDSIIILQADHGGDAFGNPGILDKINQKERYRILTAVRGFEISETITPVNMFRTLFGLKLLEKKRYFKSDQDEKFIQLEEMK